MKTIALLIASLIVVLASSSCSAQGFPKLEDLEKNRIQTAHNKEVLETYKAKVVGVSDGDTLDVLTAGKDKIRIRLDSIDTPESRQDFGKRSKQALSKLIFGKEVTVQEVGKDRYGRMLGFIQVDGKDVATEMVRSGHAWVYTEYSQSGTLPDLQDEARKAKAGLWSHGKPVAPWTWRKEQRAARQK